MTPNWNQSFTFADVSAADTIQVGVYGLYRMLATRAFLGRCTISMSEVADARPHYFWRPLVKKAEKEG